MEPKLPDVRPTSHAHWADVGDRRTLAQRSRRCQALHDIHALVKSELLRAQVSESVLVEHDRVLPPGPDLPPAEFGLAEHEFALHIGASLGLLAAHTQKADSQADRPRYGGDIGNLIFQAFSKSSTVPALLDFIGEIDLATRNMPVEQARDCVNAALGRLIRIGTADRGLVAHMTGTKDAELFGKHMPPEGHLYDPVSNRPSWGKWAALVNSKISQTFAAGKFTKATPNEVWNDWHDWRDWPDGPGDWPADQPLDIVTSKDGRHRLVFNSTTSEGVLEGLNSSGVRYAFHLKDSSADQIGCHHRPAPVDKPVEAEFENEFFDVIRMNDPSVDLLQEALARLLHRVSTGSLLFRGGAAFAERLLQALANHHGYELSYSPAWTPPAGIQPDQQALSVFDIEEFVKCGAQHLILTPASALN